MTPNEIRTTLLSQKQRVADITQGWTVVSCSPDNELTAMAALLVPNCSLATGSIAELLAELPKELEQLLVICDDTLPDGGVIELMRQLREARPKPPAASWSISLKTLPSQGWSSSWPMEPMRSVAAAVGVVAPSSMLWCKPSMACRAWMEPSGDN